jgi:GWxTD domain-containing protein
MMVSLRWSAISLLLASGLADNWAQPDAKLVLTAVRSYRQDQGRTEVNAFVQVPYLLMEPAGQGAQSRLSYHIAVKVADSSGLTLLNQSWQNHAPAAARGPDAYAVDMVRFSLAPGRYRMDVSVQDSVSGRESRTAIDLEGFATTPPASDLLLSPQIREVTPGDTMPRPAELRWGSTMVTASAELQLTPLRSTAYYLLEAYSAKADSGTLSLRVADSAGKSVISTPATPVQVPDGGGVLKGQLDLTGLPPGRYDMVARVVVGEKSIERSTPFTMAPLDETLDKDLARREAAKLTDAGYFDAMTELELATAKEPLALIAASGELSKYSKDLSLRAKRRFLTEFWQRRDPTPQTPVNETRLQFYEAVAYANETFRERGRSAVPGWKTDRGRIYVRSGAPDEKLERVQAGTSPPYEVWRFRRGKDRYYIFADRSNGVGIYQLMHSNDLKEVGQPNWQEVVSIPGVQDIGRFLSIDFFEARESFR